MQIILYKLSDWYLVVKPACVNAAFNKKKKVDGLGPCSFICQGIGYLDQKTAKKPFRYSNQTATSNHSNHPKV